jgi:hypothetical protein
MEELSLHKHHTAFQSLQKALEKETRLWLRVARLASHEREVRFDLDRDDIEYLHTGGKIEHLLWWIEDPLPQAQTYLRALLVTRDCVHGVHPTDEQKQLEDKIVFHESFTQIESGGLK